MKHAGGHRHGADRHHRGHEKRENNPLFGIHQKAVRKEINRGEPHRHRNNDVGYRNQKCASPLPPCDGEVDFKPRVQKEKQDANPCNGVQHGLLNGVRREQRQLQLRPQPAKNRRTQKNADENLAGQRRLAPAPKKFPSPARTPHKNENLNQKKQNVRFIEIMHWLLSNCCSTGYRQLLFYQYHRFAVRRQLLPGRPVILTAKRLY
ncbi:MAG TPA: hypothetical protein PK722_06155 [Kiritimatiellia bacterium]|nr:hypothetical protein [Kiritimatiellia bacterium]